MGNQASVGAENDKQNRIQIDATAPTVTRAQKESLTANGISNRRNKKTRNSASAKDEPDGPTNIRNERLSKDGVAQIASSIDNIRAQQEEVLKIDHTLYEYPFENYIMEGGGAKGIAYIGCIKAMIEVGIKPKRIAGSSAGAIAAVLYAVGYSTEEMAELLGDNISSYLIDHKCGACSLLPNLINKYGWNPGNVFLESLGDLIYDKMGNRDLTFKQLYDRAGIELCITATNVNMMSVEYFHPKTTPNVTIRLAARMSVAIPGIMQAVKVYEPSLDEETVYIDGGVLCNYPIHAFDGWWLSMKFEDSFLNKMQPLSQIHRLMEKNIRFGAFNDKTLGFLVYSAMEQEVMQGNLESRVGVKIEERPDTPLYRTRKIALENQLQALEEHQVFLGALDKFLEVLKECNKKKVMRKVNYRPDKPDAVVDDVIDKNELKVAISQAMANSEKISVKRLQKEAREAVLNQMTSCHPREPNGADDNTEEIKLTSAHLEILFGSNKTLDEIFDELDADGSGYISYDELLQFIERSGISIQAKFQGYERREVKGLKDFAVGVQDCLLTNVKRIFMDERDFKRTVGINTDYLETTDFFMDPADREFLINQGYRATVSFLKHYVHLNDPPIRNLQQDTPPSHQPITTQPLPNPTNQPLDFTDSVTDSQTGGRGPQPRGRLPPLRGKASNSDNAQTALVHSSTPLTPTTESPSTTTPYSRTLDQSQTLPDSLSAGTSTNQEDLCVFGMGIKPSTVPPESNYDTMVSNGGPPSSTKPSNYMYTTHVHVYE